MKKTYQRILWVRGGGILIPKVVLLGRRHRVWATSPAFNKPNQNNSYRVHIARPRESGRGTAITT